MQPEQIMKIELRPWQMTDLFSLINYANDIEVARFMTDAFPHPYTEESAVEFIENCNNRKPVQIFAISLMGEAIGSIGVFPCTDIMRRNAEMGYWLGSRFKGRGIMPVAVKKMLTYAFENFNIDRIFARPFGNNLASQRVLEKSGFSLEARFEKTIIKNEELLDELIYAIRKK
jgi:ribosomal-protein-alanine N-acetyltransferase